MGPLRLISSLLINRRCDRCRSLAHHHHRRAQQATVKLITLLEYFQYAVGLQVMAFLHGHGLVMLCIERLAALRIDSFQLITLQGVLEHFQRQLNPFAHRADVFIVRVGQLKATFQAVNNRQQVISEFFQREFVSLLDILLGTAADVLQIGGNTQRLILRSSQLLFEHLHTSRQLITGSRIGVWSLRILRLFVSHRFLLSKSCANSTRASVPVYGATISRFKSASVTKSLSRALDQFLRNHSSLS